MRFHTGSLLAGIASALALSISMPVAASDDAAGTPAPAVIDSGAAEGLARREGCLKCHGVDKDKEGPSFKKLSAKYRGKSEAEERLLKHLRSGSLVKFSDGEEEEHRIIRSKDESAVMNLIGWILSR
jgi:cytochrome c